MLPEGPVLLLTSSPPSHAHSLSLSFSRAVTPRLPSFDTTRDASRPRLPASVSSLSPLFQQGRKDAVNTAGYGSDSSDDGEGVVPSRKPGAAKDGDDDSDDDMFAAAPSAAGPTKGDEGGGKKTTEKFLKLGDIEGQEFGKGDDDEDGGGGGAGGGGDESDDSKDGMGYELSSFNMKSELREGQFTEEGAYVSNAKDTMEIHDRWLDGVDSKEAMRRTREAKKRRDEMERREEERKRDRLRDGGGREELVEGVVALLERGETVLEALQRLGGTTLSSAAVKGKGGKKLSWIEQQRERKRLLAEQAQQAAASTGAGEGGGMEVDGASKVVSPFDKLTSLTAELTALGQLDIYTMSREQLQRLLPPPARPAAEAAPLAAAPSVAPQGPPAPPADDGSRYEYRYTMDYLRSMPEGERPVEREIFGGSCLPRYLSSFTH